MDTPTQPDRAVHLAGRWSKGATKPSAVQTTSRDIRYGPDVRGEEPAGGGKRKLGLLPTGMAFFVVAGMCTA